MKRISVLGSTGSIGISTLDVVRQFSGDWAVQALIAGRNAATLLFQIQEFRPKVVVVADGEVRSALKALLSSSGISQELWPEIEHGVRAQIAAVTAPEVDFVMSAIVGVAGLEATFEAIRAGKRIGLANKEVLVAAGEVVMREVRERRVELLPVDSEHNGAHQCFRAGRRDEVQRLLLTASGGPFRNTPAAQLANVTPAQALEHPTWKMGPRITVDSASLMNKGFEVIEACWLFDLAPSQVEVVVHPQSSIHAMVEYVDGSVMAQVSATDMRMPIQYALTYPKRQAGALAHLDWSSARTWNFFPPDLERFPALRLAYEAAATGGGAGCVLNAADEIAVEAFLKGKIPFTAIPTLVEETLNRYSGPNPATIGDVVEADRAGRAIAQAVLEESGAKVLLSTVEAV